MNNFDYRDFNLTHLKKIKKIKNLSIGLGLPILNEEKTLRKILAVIHSCGDFLDYVICIDSRSNDHSVEICRKAGFKVIADYKIAKKLGVSLHRGKGWNLWGSLYYLKTDIVIWVDSDIKNFTKRFITGIAGPLIEFDDIKFVKGYYHRPRNDARVTEIMVRPFLNFLLPELKNFIQPLSGEYGGRRDFLKKIKFISGYSVEIILLWQAISMLSPKEVAQVFLGRRIHRLRDVLSLSEMSSHIFLTMLKIAKKIGKINLDLVNLPRVLHRFKSGIDGKFIKEDVEIKEYELPSVNDWAKSLRNK